MRMSGAPSIACLAALALALGGALACSTPSAAPDAGSDAGTDAGNGDAGSDAGGSCSPPMVYGGGEASAVGGMVTALIVDETGAPVPGQPAYICGLDLCSPPAMTSAGGTVTLTTSLSMKKPAFKYGDAVSYAEFAIPLTAASTDFTQSGTGKLACAKLAGKPGAALTPGGSAVSGEVTVSLAADAGVGIDTLVYSTADEQLFRAVQIPLANLGPVLADATLSGGASANFGLVFGVAPAETTLCPPAQITVALPSTLGWVAGAAVEFWVTTDDTAQQFAPYAGWAFMSDGQVSADGKSATTAAGQGFNFLESFAVRLK
jgi:hypothetical protein